MLLWMLAEMMLTIVLFVTAFVTFVERKVIALIQRRRGPNVYEVKLKDLCMNITWPWSLGNVNSDLVESYQQGFFVGQLAVFAVLVGGYCIVYVGRSAYYWITSKSDANNSDTDTSDSDDDA